MARRRLNHPAIRQVYHELLSDLDVNKIAREFSETSDIQHTTFGRF